VTRVLVVDDHEPSSDALESVLERADGVHVVGATADRDDAARTIAGGDADVVLVDVERPEDAIVATRAIRAADPGARVVVVSAERDHDHIGEAIAAGACGYLPRAGAATHVGDVVRRAAAGELVLPEDDLGPVLERLERARTKPTERALDRLTARETDILRRLASGETAGEIADGLGISALTVQSHVKSILAKLGVHSKIEAVTLAWRHGLAATPRPV